MGRSISVDVDVDLESFDTDELVEEVCDRLRVKNRKTISAKQKQDLKTLVANINSALLMSPERVISVESLDDKMKYEHLAKVFKKYSWADMEKMLPE